MDDGRTDEELPLMDVDALSRSIYSQLDKARAEIADLKELLGKVWWEGDIGWSVVSCSLCNKSGGKWTTGAELVHATDCCVAFVLELPMEKVG